MKHLILLLIAFTTLSSLNCTKDQKPTYFGKWETVQAFGVAFEYNIEKGGQFCQKAPEVFGQTSFCYDYSTPTDTELIVQGNQVSTWVWSFVCSDVADVTVTLDDSTVQRIILKKIQ